MAKEEQILFTLLKSSLNNTDCNLMTFAEVAGDTWQGVFSLAEEQSLLGVVFSAIERLPKTQLPQMELLMDWVGQIEYITSRNLQYREEASKFLAKVRGKGLEVRILKGTECAKYYPQPDRRSLGDLDIFCVNPNANNGYEEVNRICKEMGLDVDYHDYKHSKIHYNNLTVENHRYCTEIRGEKVKKEFEREIQRLLIEGLKVRGERLENVNKVLPPNALTANPQKQFEALFLVAHAFNHFMDEGLSLRQICDWAIFVKAEQDNVDWTDFYTWMERMHMRHFADALNAIAVADLGVVISNKAIVTTSPYKEKILKEALHGNNHLHNSGLRGWRYRLAQLRIAYQDRWKYSDICGSNWLVEYVKSVWFFFTEKNPKI